MGNTFFLECITLALQCSCLDVKLDFFFSFCVQMQFLGSAFLIRTWMALTRNCKAKPWLNANPSVKVIGSHIKLAKDLSESDIFVFHRVIHSSSVDKM